MGGCHFLCAGLFGDLVFIPPGSIPFSWLWALALLGISDAFLYRMSITRAQSLSLGVLALGFLWLLEGRYWRLAMLSFIYVWLYDAFPLLIAFSDLVAVALIEHRLETRPLIFIGAGILGMLINPYFPVNISFSIQHMLPKLTDATSVRVGNEWYPYDTDNCLIIPCHLSLLLRAVYWHWQSLVGKWMSELRWDCLQRFCLD